MEQIAGVVEVLERTGHGGGIRGIAEQAGAQTLVEEVIDPGGEELVIFGFCFTRPRLRMTHQPQISFLPPFLEQADRDRIRETERERIRGLVLLPVGETVSGLLNLRELVEELQSRIGGCVGFHNIKERRLP